jgi:hypothetical protein
MNWLRPLTLLHSAKESNKGAVVEIKAVFVGINKHRDSTIPELSGARRDATALWALFTDTVAGLVARLLVDERATYTEVSKAILGTLSSAQDNDVVVLTFAGHRSPDGALRYGSGESAKSRGANRWSEESRQVRVRAFKT